MRRSVLFIGGVVAVAVAGTAFAGVMIWTLLAQREAGQLLGEVNSIRVGVSPFDDAKRIADRHRGAGGEDGPCTRENCRFTFRVANRPLWTFRIWMYGFLPPTQFTASLEIRDEVVVGKYAGVIAQHPDRQYSMGAASELAYRDPLYRGAEQPAFRIQHWSNVPDSIDVRLQATATDDQRRRAFAINVTCFSRIDGCQSAQEIMPLMQQDER